MLTIVSLVPDFLDSIWERGYMVVASVHVAK